MKKITTLSVLLASLGAASALPTWEPFVNQTANNIGSAYAGANGGSYLYNQTNATGEYWHDWNGGSGPLSVLVTNLDFNTVSFPSGFPANYPAIPTNSAWLPSTGVNANTGQSACLGFNQAIFEPAGKASKFGAASTNTVFVSFLVNVPSVQNVGSPIFIAGLVPSSLVPGAGFAAGGTPPGAPSADLRFYIAGSATAAPYALGITNVNGAALNLGGDFQTNNFESASTAYFVVIDYELAGTNTTTGTVTNDYARMWINPALNTFGAPVAPSVSTATAGTVVGVQAADALTNVGGFYFLARTGGTQPTNGMYFADLSVGTTWSYVTGGPEFSAQPTNDPYAVLGGNVILNCKATALGNQAVTYRWLKSGTPLSDGLDGNGSTISGSATSSLTISGITPGDLSSYSVVATDPISSITSAVVKVSMDPTITVQPVNLSVTAQTTNSFTISAVTQSLPLTYQWQRNGVNLVDGTSATGTIYSGSQTPTLTLGSIGFGDNQAVYDCVVSNGLGVFTTSSLATLTVNDPVLTSQPASVTTNYLGNAAYSVTAAGTAPFSYQWKLNGTNLSDGPSVSGSGATVAGSATSLLHLSGVTYLDIGSYTVVITDGSGSVTSSVAHLTVNDPYIITQPTPATQAPATGGTVHYTVSAAGSPTVTYQWLKNGVALSDGLSGSGSSYSGTLTSTLTLANVTTNDNGGYAVVIGGASGTNITSAAATLNVLIPVSLLIPPQSLRVATGANVPFAAVIGGSVTAYQWQLNGVNIPGATNSTFVTNKVSMAAAGTYSLVASNLVSSVTATATLTVSATVIPFSTNNLIVARVGDGVQVLNNTTGNTLYFDQYTTNGSYVSTTVIPDTGTNSLLVSGGGVDGPVESVVTMSTNQQSLVFTGFNTPRPATNSGGVGAGYVTIRGIAELNGLGYFSLVLTNLGLYSGGDQIRCAASTDGATNFWTTGGGLGNTGGLKYVNPYLALGGLGLPELVMTTDARVVVADNFGDFLYFTLGSNSVSPSSPGWYEVAGLPTNGPPTGGPSLSIVADDVSDPTADPNDIAVFTDPGGNTVMYLADDRPVANGGGIQRWDNGGLSYTLPMGLTNTSGAWAVTVDFSQYSNGTNEIIYATTAVTNGNQLIRIVDGGAASTGAVLATAGPTEIFRGLRFGPQTAPLQIIAQPQSQMVSVNESVDFTVGLTGSSPFYFQWQFNGANIAGATNSVYSLPNVALTNAGNYSVIVSNLLSSNDSAMASLQVSAFNTNNNLVGWWPFNDGAGSSTAADLTSYDNTGQLLNFPDNTGEWIVSFDGLTALNFAYPNTNSATIQDTVTVADSPILNFSNNLAFTLSAWVQSATNNQVSGAALIAKGWSGNEQYSLNVYPSNTFRFLVRNGLSAPYAINSSNVLNGFWQHVTATYDGNAGIMSLYVNGSLVGSLTGTNVPGGLWATSWPLSFGNDASSALGTYNLPFMGSMQDVRIYNYALGAQDVQAVYDSLAAPNFISITSSPLPQTANVGGSASFAVNVAGPTPYGYQWRLNATNVLSATNATLTISPVQLANAGNYTVVVSNPYSSLTSAGALLTVIPPAPSMFSTNGGVLVSGNGQVTLTFSGPVGSDYRLWSTTNLATVPIIGKWTLLTNSVFPSGPVTIVDNHATNVVGYYTITQP